MELSPKRTLINALVLLIVATVTLPVRSPARSVWYRTQPGDSLTQVLRKLGICDADCSQLIHETAKQNPLEVSKSGNLVYQYAQLVLPVAELPASSLYHVTESGEVVRGKRLVKFVPPPPAPPLKPAPVRKPASVDPVPIERSEKPAPIPQVELPYVFRERFRLLLSGGSVINNGQVAYSTTSASVKIAQSGILRAPQLALETEIALGSRFSLVGKLDLFSATYPAGNRQTYAAYESNIQLGAYAKVWRELRAGLFLDQTGFGYVTASGTSGSFAGDTASSRGARLSLAYRHTLFARAEAEVQGNLRINAMISGSSDDTLSGGFGYSGFEFAARAHYLITHSFYVGPNLSYQQLGFAWKQGTSGEISNSYSASEIRMGLHLGLSF